MMNALHPVTGVFCIARRIDMDQHLRPCIQGDNFLFQIFCNIMRLTKRQAPFCLNIKGDHIDRTISVCAQIMPSFYAVMPLYNINNGGALFLRQFPIHQHIDRLAGNIARQIR